MKRIIVILITGSCCFLCRQEAGASVTYFNNFDSGPGADFVTFMTAGTESLWTIDNDGPQLEISKPVDNGSILPNNFIAAGYKSTFLLGGDFTVTVDFGLSVFPDVDQMGRLNESFFDIRDGLGNRFGILRFVRNLSGSENRVEVWDGLPRNDQSSSLFSGQYRITRVGSTLTGSIGSGGSFTTVYSGSGFTGDAEIWLFAVQGFEVGNSRSTTALDITFDNLNITADHIQIIPAPGAALLAGFGIGCVNWLRKRTVI